MSGKHLTEDQIQRMIASDPDALEATEDQLAQARPFTEVFPALAEAMRKNVGGASESGRPEGCGVPAPGPGRGGPVQGQRSRLADPDEQRLARRGRAVTRRWKGLRPDERQ